MPKFFKQIEPQLRDWALKQAVFFTASAPSSGKHINISPKGLPSSSLSFLTPNQVAYVDATGSGAETISHIYENGRVTIMFCSFDALPRIMRLFCTGRVIEWDDKDYEKWLAKTGKRIEGARAVIVLDVFKVQTSCGYGVPKLAKHDLSPSNVEKAAEWEFGFEDRDTLGHWAKYKVDKSEMHSYQQKNNSESLDGLTGLKAGRRDGGELLWWTDLLAWTRKIWGQKDAVMFGFAIAVWAHIIMKLLEIIR